MKVDRPLIRERTFGRSNFPFSPFFLMVWSLGPQLSKKKVKDDHINILFQEHSLSLSLSLCQVPEEPMKEKEENVGSVNVDQEIVL